MESRVLVLHADREPMKGVTNPGPHQIYRNPKISVERRVLGELRSDEIRVKMLYGGICGTDIHLVETNPDTGYIQCSAPALIPPEGRVIGHEGVGRVVKVGSSVNHIKAGAYVTFESILVCQYCEACKRGHFNQCYSAKLLGLEMDGLFGEIVDVPAMLAHDVTPLARDKKTLMAASCIEPAGVAYVACENTHITGGDVVVIFGAGPIGLFSAILSKAVFGASVVHMVEPIEFRRTFSQKWCDFVYDVNDFFDKGPSSVDVVIETSGNMENITKILRRVRANGRIALLARSGTPLVLDAIDYMITNAVSLTGSRGHLGGAFAKILNLCQNSRIALDEVVTCVINGVEELCKLFKSPEQILYKNCKVLVCFNTENNL